MSFQNWNKMLVMIDRDGDENYQPMLIPMEGGYPEPAFNNFFAKYRVHLGECDRGKGIVYLQAERRDKPMIETYRGDLKTGKLTKIAQSAWGYGVGATAPTIGNSCLAQAIPSAMECSISGRTAKRLCSMASRSKNANPASRSR
jgi:hypothetical protein